MKCLIFVLILLFFSFSSALEIDLDCPDEIFVDEEFECELEVSDGDGVYDVKIDLDGEKNSVLEIWDEELEDWKSAYYYLKEAVKSGDKIDILLRISKDGEYNGVLKLRQGSKIESFDIEIEAEEFDKEKAVKGEVVEEDGEEIVQEIIENFSNKPIVLNAIVENKSDDKLVYLSKSAQVIEMLPYLFSLFLIFIIGILIWEKKEQKTEN